MHTVFFQDLHAILVGSTISFVTTWFASNFWSTIIESTGASNLNLSIVSISFFHTSKHSIENLFLTNICIWCPFQILTCILRLLGNQNHRNISYNQLAHLHYNNAIQQQDCIWVGNDNLGKWCIHNWHLQIGNAHPHSNHDILHWSIYADRPDNLGLN